MKIRFDTTSGVDTKKWECLLTVSCTPDSETPDDLLSGGWLFDPITRDWYMSRSVRINLAEWEPSKSSEQAVNEYEWQTISSLGKEEVEMLRSYRAVRGIIDYPYDAFKDLGQTMLEKGSSKYGNCWHMTVQFGTASLYPMCAFDKAGTKISPGKACWTRACQVSKDHGAKYLYAYEGYGLGSSYKSDYIGFEWWDGSSWCSDKARYLECLRDDGAL